MASIDQARLTAWFEQFAPQLVLYARQWLDAPAAEDVVQNVFVKLLSKRIIPRNERAWTFRVVRNESISRLRSQQRRQSRETRAGQVRAHEAGWFTDRQTDLIDAERAQNALMTLSIDDREIIVLRIWGELTFEQIGSVTGRPISTVHRMYQHALAQMRAQMERTPCPTNRASRPE